MAESTVVRNKRDETLVISHAGSGTYTVAYEVGDFEVDYPLEGVDNYLDRGVMPSTPSIRKGDDQEMTGSFTVYLRDAERLLLHAQRVQAAPTWSPPATPVA